MLVFPGDLGLRKHLALSRRRGRIGNLGDEIRGRCFRNTIHQYTDKGCLQDDSEAKGKTKKNTLAVKEPSSLLLRRKLDATEVRFELRLISWLSNSRLAYLPVHASNYEKQNSYEGK